MMQRLSREEVLEIVRAAREKGERADLSRVDLSEVQLSQANLRGAILYEVNLRRAFLTEVNLSQANLMGSNLSQAILVKSNLSKAFLLGVNLNGADLSQANLSQANLVEANLSGVNLNEANLSGANFHEADLREALLTEVDLSEASLIGANLFRANLSKADLTGVTLGWTIFGDVDLSDIKGSETVKHLGPSTIGVDTLFRSKGQIPEVFLRKASVPEDLIRYLEKIKTPQCKYTLEQLDEYIENGQKYLTTIYRSLHLLKDKKAKYGLDVPLSIEHQILDYETEQAKAEERLAEYSRLRTLYYPSGS